MTTGPRRYFAGREELLIRALHHGRVEAWALASQVLRPDQIDLLDYLPLDWRRHNPDMVKVIVCPPLQLCHRPRQSAKSEVLAASGLYRQCRATRPGHAEGPPAYGADVLHAQTRTHSVAMAGGYA